jgi:hypothetical protein
MLRMSEEAIDEVVLLDFGDDGATFLCPISFLLRARSRTIPVLPRSKLVPNTTKRPHPQATALGHPEQCPFCQVALSDEWVRAAHSRVVGRVGGRPPVLRPCPLCKEEFGARELRVHVRLCGGKSDVHSKRGSASSIRTLKPTRSV